MARTASRDRAPREARRLVAGRVTISTRSFVSAGEVRRICCEDSAGTLAGVPFSGGPCDPVPHRPPVEVWDPRETVEGAGLRWGLPAPGKVSRMLSSGRARHRGR